MQKIRQIEVHKHAHRSLPASQCVLRSSCVSVPSQKPSDGQVSQLDSTGSATFNFTLKPINHPFVYVCNGEIEMELSSYFVYLEPCCRFSWQSAENFCPLWTQHQFVSSLSMRDKSTQSWVLWCIWLRIWCLVSVSTKTVSRTTLPVTQMLVPATHGNERGATVVVA